MTTWTTSNKSATPTWTGADKSGVSTDQYELNVGSGYRLLIDATHYLLIQPASNGTTWTFVNKN